MKRMDSSSLSIFSLKIFILLLRLFPFKYSREILFISNIVFLIILYYNKYNMYILLNFQAHFNMLQINLFFSILHIALIYIHTYLPY